MEQENTFVKDLIIKIIMVVLFVFLLMWLYPLPNLNPLYDRLFVDNIETMKNAGKSYFTLERLPKEVGATEVLSLEEMQTRKLVLPIVDSKGEFCDPHTSYVEVMKMETEYIIKAHLSCSTKTDYVIEHLGCYDLCQDVCQTEEKEEEVIEPQIAPTPKKPTPAPIKPQPQVKKNDVVEYQFSRELYQGYKIINGTVTEYEHVKYADKISDYKYECEKGKKVGTECKIEEKVSSTIPARVETATSTYTVNAEKRNEIDSYTIPAKREVTTTSYTVAAKTDTRTTSYTVAAQKEVLTSSYTIAAKANTTTTYTCSEGVKEGNQCKIQTADGYTYGSWVYKRTETSKSPLSVYENATEKRVYVGTEQQYACDGCFNMVTIYKYSIYQRSATPKYKTTYVPAKANITTTYTCSAGVKEGDKCRIYETTNVYTCSKGTREGDRCRIYETTTDYYCPPGTREGSKCRIYETIDYYTCSQGTVEGNRCRITDIITSYYCPQGTLVGSKCRIDEYSTIYICDKGQLEGKKCRISEIKTTFKEAKKIPIYKRVEVDRKWSIEKKLTGWETTGQKRERTTSSEKVYTGWVTSLPAGYKITEQKTEYKWSTNRSLPGWTKTGKTRKTNLY